MKTGKFLRVRYKNRDVGTLAPASNGKTAFEYDSQWLEEGFPVSPFSLPFRKQVFFPEKYCFSGLFGVFADSLPDAWGNLQLNRLLLKKGIDPGRLDVCDRLAIVGSSGRGALTFHPGYDPLPAFSSLDPEELYRLGGTGGGSRPKIMTRIDGEDWIIKFPGPSEDADAGVMEYEYSLCAKDCGIAMPQTRLFPSKKCGGFFGVRRFDRIRGADGKRERVHMLSVAAILEEDIQEPSQDYHTLMKLTKILTRDSREDLEQLFRRMCFNVFAENRDDHLQNFSFLYDEEKDRWRLSPAYDLTKGSGFLGEHMTGVDGEWKNPGKEHLLAVGRRAGISSGRCAAMIREVQEKTRCLRT